MEQISKMAAEVNKLIGGKLLAGKSIYLPGIGSLYISMTTSQRKRVEFSSAQQGDSLVDVITARAKCSDEDGEKIYKHYINEVKEGLHLTILGVGVLNGKSFATDEDFSAQLNAQSEPAPVVVAATASEPAPAKEVVKEPVIVPIAPAPKSAPKPKVEPKKSEKVMANKPEKKSGAKRAIIAIAVVIVILAGAYFAYRCIEERKAEAAAIEAAELARVKEAQRVADSIRVAELEARQAAEVEVVEEIAPYRVVYGIFREKSNADRALVDIDSRFGKGSARAIEFASYTLVSMFEAESRAECQSFLMENYDEFPDTWIYESR